MKIIERVFLAICMLLLVFAGMLHGASIAGFSLGVFYDGRPFLKMSINFFEQNMADQTYVAFTLFTILHFALTYLTSLKRERAEGVSKSTNMKHFKLSLVVYLFSMIAFGCLVAVSLA